jgi:hypothetical protein
LPELSFIQRLDHPADKIASCHDFQSPSVDSHLGCIVSTLLCQEPRMFLPIRTRHNLDVLKFSLSQKRPCAIPHWQILQSQQRIVGRLRALLGRTVRDKFAGPAKIPAQEHLALSSLNSRWKSAPFYKGGIQIDDAWTLNIFENA